MNIASTSVALLLAAASAEGENRKSGNATEVKMTETAQIKNHPYVGMWVTGDGHVRQELLPNGRYDEARGNRKSAYQGRYEVKGNHIDYWDDTGFTADGEFVDDILYHGGMIFYREK
ncbi:Atu4866 domain-containing protein [Rhizobium pusense]|uniref:Atu4866 domain-containing protein n=1 Tax=Agrobacterium pusense TaxID=648995 RepID=UPI001FCB932B|nr:Atu4866 domain-containing protein [Agrobacterium pusense]MCJ2873616.1 Atu4866 domain-containing protein [Agrobacterium pusense]